MTDVYGYSSSPPQALDPYTAGLMFGSSAGGGPSSPFLAGEDDLDVDASFASSMSISSNENRPAYRSPHSPYQPLPSQPSAHVSMDVSPAYSSGSSAKHPFQAPSHPPPPPPSFASSSSSSSVRTLRRPSPPPARPSFSRVRAESAELKRTVTPALGSTRRAFGKEISINMDSPSRSPAQGPTTVKALGGLMGPPALPGSANGSPSAAGGKSAGGGLGAVKTRAPLPSQWKTVKTMGGGSDMRRGGKLFAPAPLSRRDSEPAFTDALPVPNIHRPASQEYLSRSSLEMDVDDDENDSPFLPSIPASPVASFGAGGYDDFFTGSPSTAPAHKTSFGLGRPQSSSPESSPSSKRSSGGALGSVRSTGGGNLFERAFSAGPASGGLFGGARAATVANRRMGPYKRPTLAHFQTSNTMDVTDSPSASQTSAFPIMSAQNPSLANGLAPPHPRTVASESSAFSGATFPRTLPPIRRAYSVSTEVVHDDANASSPDCSFEEASPSQPTLKAQEEYAQRHRSRVVRLADGSPAFRPAREGELADGGMKSPSEGSPFHFGGFGSNEKDGKILPCHTSPEDGLMRIDCSTLDNLISGKYASAVTNYHIIDCRFDYEFAGGHIDGAVNIRNENDIAAYLLTPGQGISANGSALPAPSTSSGPSPSGGKTVLVFHCEFSKKRGPEMAKKFRTADRAKNQEFYPALHYPEVYILEGGYCEFYSQRPATCNPSAYVTMDDPLHQVKRSTDIHEFRTRKFNRAQSWTGGDNPVHPSNSLFTNATVRPHSAALPSLAFAAGAAAQGKRRGAAERHVIEEEDHSDLSFSSADGGGLGSPCAAPRANAFLPMGQAGKLKARVAMERTKSSPLVLGGSLFAGHRK